MVPKHVAVLYQFPALLVKNHPYPITIARTSMNTMPTLVASVP
jgi:hypothetical protein